MEKRTEEIIAVCKGMHDLGEFKTFKESIAAYMADRCAFPAEDYTDGMIEGILFEALCDFIDGADRPSAYLRRVNDSARRHNGNMISAICGAFCTVSVQDKEGNFKNGFNKDSVFEVKKRKTI